MEPIQLPSNIKKILSVTFILTVISAFIVIFIGTALRYTHQDIKQLNLFITSAKNIQSNFEESLQIYTERTQAIMNYLFSLRPDDESDFVSFIAEIERIEQESGLEVNLQSLNQATPDEDEDEIETLNYNLNFYGNMGDLKNFLLELEKLPYYIRVDQINFIDLNYITDKEKKQNGNISLIIKVYIRKV